MKIITWNADRAFRKKKQYIDHFQADLLIIPECERFEKLQENEFFKDLQEKNFYWDGRYDSKGLGIILLNDSYKIEKYEPYDKSLNYIIPLKITGKENFNLLAIWSQKSTKVANSYIAQIQKALDTYKDLLTEPCMIIGDWNSSSKFDRLRRIANHSQVVKLLEGYGIKSMYHEFYQEEHGKESKPTFYARKQRTKPFHIDYAFASANFLYRIEHVSVGEYEEYRIHSDHMPLFIELTDR